MPVPRDGTTFTSGHMGRYTQPLSGLLISVILALASIALISAFLTQKLFNGRSWRKIQFVQWVAVAIYIDSWIFVFATAIIQFGFGVDFSFPVCDSAILLCLLCYVSSKILVYLFLVEKAYIIRGNLKPRLKSRVYIFNSIIMLGLYVGVAIVNFVFRITKMQDGQCVIGMQKQAMIPLIGFDVLVNVYLTCMFLVPLFNMYTFKNAPRTRASNRLKRVATRTFIGAVCTLTSSVVNLSVLMGLNGEPGWVCLMCCNSDILFSVVVIQWVTSPDGPQGGSNSSSKDESNELGSQNGEPDNRIVPARLRLGRRGNHSDLEDFDTPDVPTRSHSRASSRRELSTEGMIDGRAAISVSHSRNPSGSTDTLPSTKPFDLDVASDPAPAQDKQSGAHGRPEIATPEEARVRGSNLYVSRIWRSGP
ncbi:hypothetical protein CONLIGDRAFT_455527 [Coniochaeta ligniaria NRRL 30616]|uniref:Uncharacterized protein n=1 Tax=Coniochaeta ligniaria NRRL 30616 TaxID=1408157 RepID=A0A1J7IKY4_9PEZI|nr:hypothetical protein CONLIGDRAFT_455527 [Coniochaeta ligniaria NRRL 30616]